MAHITRRNVREEAITLANWHVKKINSWRYLRIPSVALFQSEINFETARAFGTQKHAVVQYTIHHTDRVTAGGTGKMSRPSTKQTHIGVV